MARRPELKWAQREDKLYITIMLSDAKDAKVSLEPQGTFTFSATAGGENHLYEMELHLFNNVNVEESKINIGPRSIFCVVVKAEEGWWTKLLRGDDKTPHFVKVDWDKWADEDDDGLFFFSFLFRWAFYIIRIISNYSYAIIIFCLGPEVDTSGMDFSV
ncbi:prostaglandin-E synthase [Ranunculus cassubicifolius]